MSQEKISATELCPSIPEPVSGIVSACVKHGKGIIVSKNGHGQSDRLSEAVDAHHCSAMKVTV